MLLSGRDGKGDLVCWYSGKGDLVYTTLFCDLFIYCLIKKFLVFSHIIIIILLLFYYYHCIIIIIIILSLLLLLLYN